MAVSRTSSSGGGGGRFGCAPLHAPLSHIRSHFSNVSVCVCGSGRVPRSLNVMFLGWLRLQEPALKPQRGTPPLVPQRALSPQREGTDRAHTRGNKAKKQRKKPNVHSTRGNTLLVSAGTNRCALIGLKLLKKDALQALRPARTAPERSRDESRKVIHCQFIWLQYLHLRPVITAVQICS